MKRLIILALALAALAAIHSCSASQKLRKVRANATNADIRLAQERELPSLGPQTAKKRDTLKVTDVDGTELLIMQAIKDEQTGEMVASEVLDAAVVTARFRNVAERRGEVDIEFQIVVSDSLLDKDWQLRFNPRMYILEDTVRLDPVLITGEGFRNSQLRGYQRYERFLKDISRDSAYFVDWDQLERFLERNLPQVFRYKTDTTIVSQEEFESAFGVTEKMAVEHYTRKWLIASNARKVGRKGKMWKRFVPNPIISSGIRLDTVIHTDKGDFIYNYVQTVKTRPRLRKVDIVLSGDIRNAKEKIYTMPDSEPLTFYISSLSSLVDNTERYLTKVVERRVEANTSCNVDFATGRSDINLSLGSNSEETARIRHTLARLMENDTFDLDSVVVTASCSPDGRLASNGALALRRSESVTGHFRKFIREYRDSLEREKGFAIDEDGNIVKAEEVPDIRLLSRSVPEDWDGLSERVWRDTVLTREQKEEYDDVLRMKDPDARERSLRTRRWYATRVVKDIYPKLRTVHFEFHLHRKGMVKDTIHTTVLDTTYMDGVQAIRDHDYEQAIALLRPYQDFNTAIAFLAMDYNASARAILEKLEQTPQINYMLAVLYSRDGDDQKAVERYIHACKMDPSYVHRGNLDPEISVLIKRYNLNAQPEDEFEYSF